MKSIFTLKKLPVLIVSAVILSGCAQLSRKELPVPANVSLPPVIKPVEEVIGASDAAETTIAGAMDEDMFISSALVRGEDLPKIEVSTFSISNATIYTFMKTILDGESKVSFSIDSDHGATNVVRHFVTASNVSGTLKNVLDEFSNSMGFFYYYANSIIHLTPEQQFIAKIPPVNTLFDSLPPMIKTLGGTEVFIDKTSRTMTYRATKPAQNKIEAYLKWIRDNKKLIIYDTYIAEVVLDDATSTGIQWNKLGWTGSVAKTPVAISASNAATAATGAIGVGSVFTGGHFAMDAMASFLKTQGTVNQISKIPMMMVSGSDTTFHNGGVDYYISSIGAPTVSATGVVTPGQSVLSPLKTGIDLKLTGDISDGTIFTTVDLSMNSLTGYVTFPAGQGQSMQAPKTSDRSVSTTVRIRAGDTILIAGINYEKSQSSTAGLPFTQGTVALPTNISKSAQRSELVVVIRPKVVSFSKGFSQ